MIIEIKILDDDMLNTFIQKVNELKDWEELHLYINSGWWDNDVFEMVKQIIIDENQRRKIKLYWMYLASNGFNLIYELYKYIEYKTLPWCFWMVHMSAWSTSLWDNLMPRWDLEKFKVECQKKQKSNYPFLTDKEKEKYNEWYDIRLDYDRLLEIFKT